MKFIFEIHNEKLEVNKILIIDRDGVVIKDTGYPHKIKELKFEVNNIKKIINFIKKNDFNLCGFATNQSGVGRGYFSENQFWICHNHIIKTCRKNGLEIDFTAVNFFKSTSYYRKPNPGMINQIKHFYSVNSKNIFFIGDKSSDEKAAKNATINYNFIDQV